MKYSDNQRHIMQVVDDFCAEHAPEEKVKQWVVSRGVPNSLHEQFLSSEMGKYVLPPSLGGVETNLGMRAVLLERLMHRTGATLPVLSDMTSLAILSTMRALSQEEIADELLSKGGRLAFSQAFSEAQAGSDAAAVQTTVSVDGSEVYLNGEKTYVSAGQFMPETLVLTHDPVYGGADGGVSLWLVPISAPGISTYPLNTLGQEMLSPARISFDQVKLDLDWQIQTEGILDTMLKRQYELGRLFVCSSSLGLAEAARDDAIDYANKHMIKGRRMTALPAIQEMLADMETKIRAMRMFVYDAAEAMDAQGNEAHLACALMKRYVPKAATEVASDALQLFGGRGYTDETRVGRIWRDCRGNQIAQGTDEVMTHIVSRFVASSL